MKKSIHGDIRVVSSSVPALYGVSAADETGDTVDTAGFNAREACFHIGNAGDTWSSTDKVTPTILHSNDDGDEDAYTAVEAADLEGSLDVLVDSDADDNQVYRVGLKPSVKRYVQLKLDFGGTHATGTVCSSFVILAEPNDGPTDNP